MVSSLHLALLKAEYAYIPQSDDEIALEEDMLYYLLDDTDPEWFKVKLKVPSSSPNPPQTGLVPANYVIPAHPLRIATATYAYEAQTDDELTIRQDEYLNVYEDDGEWSLVSRCSPEVAKGVGYVPTTYLGTSAGEPEVINSDELAHASKTPLSPTPTPASQSAISYQSTADIVDLATWSVTDIDHKKKKRKGKLSIDTKFLTFTSESEKIGEQKYDMSSVSITKTEKGKHLILKCGPDERHFQVSEDGLDEIVSKIQIVQQRIQSVSAPSPAVKTNMTSASLRPPSAMASLDKSPASNARKVSFATPIGKPATALYDFEAQGDDELTVEEGDRLLVLDDTSDDDWWKCAKQADGREGVVPASYIELHQGQPSGNQEAAEAAMAAAAADEARDRRIQEEEDARLAQKLVGEDRSEAQLENARAADRKLINAREVEQRLNAEAQLAARRKKEAESRRRETEHSMANPSFSDGPAPPKLTPRPDSSQAIGYQNDNIPTPVPPKRPDSAPRESRSKPQGLIRTWRDKTGQFKVEAEFLGLQNGKIRLHKLNGITIEVPLAKISSEDVAWLEGATGRSFRSQDADDIPLANLALSPSRATPRPTPVDLGKQSNTPARSPVDWFEFFLNAGCDLDDCTRYASNFERDRIDENLLPDLEPSTMRNLGLREGDVIRVRKHIKQKYMASDENGALSTQIRKDEEFARKLQQQEAGPAPNIFTNGSNGSLKTTRRGRPIPSRSGSSVVDISSLENAKDKLIDTPQPDVALPADNPLITTTFTTDASGFDDDAWQNRPNSTTLAAASDQNPPARLTPATTVTVTPAVASESPKATPEASKPSLTDEIFEKIMNHGKASAPASSHSALAPSLQSVVTPPSINLNPSGARGPLAPVASNAPLLNPLVPLHSPMNRFVPTRATGGLQSHSTGFDLQNPSIVTSSAFNTTNPIMVQPTGMQATGMNGMGGAGGFQPPIMHPHSTGMTQPLSVGVLQAQPTGMLLSNPVSMMQPSMTTVGLQPTGFNQLGGMQTHMTGFNSGFHSTSSSIPSDMNNGGSLHPQTSAPAKSFNPVDVFSQMKTGQFAQQNPSLTAPQDPNRYNALRAQPTGLGNFSQQFTPNNNMPQMQPMQPMQPMQQSGFLQQQPLPLVAQPTGFAPGGYILNQPQTGIPGTHQNVLSPPHFHQSYQHHRGF